MDAERPTGGGLEPRKAVDFLRKSELVNIDMPVSQLVQGVSELERVAGYGVVWDRYVVVVAEAPAERSGPLAS